MAAGNYLGDDYYSDGGNQVAPAYGGIPPPQGQIFNQEMIGWYHDFLAQGMSQDQAAAATQARNQQAQGPLGVGHELPVVQPGEGVQQASAPEQAPAPQSGGGGGTGGGAPNGGLFDSGLYAPFTGQAPGYTPPTLPNAPNFDDYYNSSQYSNPVYQAPTMRQVPAFVPNQFKAPTLEEAQSQPGYQFGVQQGEKALQQSRASQGLLRTGGTLKDILDYGRNAATQNYGNVFNQDLSQFQTNEGGRVNAYNTNYETQYKDPNNYDILNAQNTFNDQLAGNNQALNVAQARFQPQMVQYQTNAANAQRQAELGYNADWQRYLDKENVFYNNQNGPFTKYLSLAQLGAANA